MSKKPLQVFSKNTCVTCKKALAYFDQQKISYTLTDIVSSPPDKALLEAWLKSQQEAGDLKTTMNTRSAAYKTHLANQPLPDVNKLAKLMMDDPNLIKRPFVIHADGHITAGFDEAMFQ